FAKVNAGEILFPCSLAVLHRGKFGRKCLLRLPPLPASASVHLSVVHTIWVWLQSVLETDLASELKNTTRECPRDLTKRGGTSISHRGIVPIRSIEDVEGVRLKQQARAPPERQSETLPQRQVPVIEGGSNNVSNRRVAGAKRACRRKRIRVGPTERLAVGANAVRV